MDVQPQQTVTTESVKVYKYRWIVLTLFCLYAGINFYQFMQYAIISNVVIRYYKSSSLIVDLSGLVFMISYIVLFVPTSYLLERYSLKTTAVVSSGLTAFGNLLKLLSVHPDRLYVYLIGQTICSIAQVAMLSLPSKIASTWFGADQVSTACAVALLGTQLGLALGSVVPSLLINDSEADEDVEKGLNVMLLSNAGASVVIFLAVIFFYRAKPELPPSQSQAEISKSDNQETYLSAFKNLIRNRDYSLLLLAYGLNVGIWTAFGIIISQIYLHYFPDGKADVGITVLIAILSGGCIGTLFFGIILDKTHAFKKVSLIVAICLSLAYAFVIFTLEMQMRIGTFISVALFGFFCASGYVLSYEYTLEVSYPISEAYSCSILNAVIYGFGIIVTVASTILMDNVGYLGAELLCLVLLLISALTLVFVSSNLRRRMANIENT